MFLKVPPEQKRRNPTTSFSDNSLRDALIVRASASVCALRPCADAENEFFWVWAGSRRDCREEICSAPDEDCCEEEHTEFPA